MSTEGQDALGRLDDEAEEREPSSTTDGPAAEGRDDPTQGSPGSHAHPVADSHPDEVTRYDAPTSRRTDVAD
jgi:hypothetical protein